MNWIFRKSSPFELSPLSRLFSYVVLGFWAFIVLFPLYWLLVTSFKQPVDVASGPKFVPFIDYQPSMHAYQELLIDDGPDYVWRPYVTTVTISITSSLLALVVGAGAAYALTRFEYRPKPGLILAFMGCVALAVIVTAVGAPWPLAVIIGIVVFFLIAQGIGRRFKGTMSNDDIAFWLISQRILPPVTVIIPIYILFQQLGMLDSPQALIITYCAANLPLVIWFMRDYFQSLPIELEESAFIDGANRFQVMQNIILPLSAPGLIATFLIVLVYSWNEYVVALFLSGSQTQTMPLLVSGQNGVRGPQWWNMSVLILIMILPVIAMAIALERYISRGLLVGAVKG